MLAETYDCLTCGHTHGVGDLVLHCGGPVEDGTALCWALPLGADPVDLATVGRESLPADYLDAGIAVVPNLTDGSFTGGTFPIRFDESNRVTMGIACGPQVRHLVVDVVDGLDRLRWWLNNVALLPAPGRVGGPAVGISWRVMATVDPSDVAFVRTRPYLQ